MRAASTKCWNGRKTQMSDLIFEPVGHTYHTPEGVWVPNVTTILGGLTDYGFVPADVLARAQAEGIAVHSMVELDCKNDLDVDTLPEWMAGHYAAWCKFKDESGFECIATEQRLHHEGFGYAGTCDLVGVTPKLRKAKGPGLIDVKRSFYAGRAIGFQTAAYSEAWNRGARNDGRITQRFALRLGANGKYNLREFDDRNDFNVFLACLTIFRARLTLREKEQQQ